ncbi:hypothetical protein PG911_06390 [Tenacibaculum ovolyticum]|uniref:hypothetical protein n=1 Tax=Tenacibaculum ovolyticum TaxID=104270 RepID=UPI0022F3E913|nr:hypothetical protein [Tenacibaculum ovolyticum]WBX77879.1 hypothetical protein PG911_06390 [Tenacibaculum ovolyticum]
MKKILCIILLLSFSCSKRMVVTKVKPKSIFLEQENYRKKEHLIGKVFTPPSLGKSHIAILLLHYNDSIKDYSVSDFDSNFVFPDFKSELINKNSYIYVVNEGCAPKKIFFNNLKKTIKITLIRDSINGISRKKYIELHSRNVPID